MLRQKLFCFYILMVCYLLILPSHTEAWSSGSLGSNLSLPAFSTHHKIDKQACASMMEVLREWKVQDYIFPACEAILRHEGANGPDGAWLREENPDSEHYYNPELDAGDAPQATQRHYELLVNELRKTSPNLERAARHAAWLAHFVADAMCPPHHHGHPQDIGTIKDNWFDPYLDPYWGGASLLQSPHISYELDVVIRNPMVNRSPMKTSLLYIPLLGVVLGVFKLLGERRISRLILISVILISGVWLSSCTDHPVIPMLTTVDLSEQGLLSTQASPDKVSLFVKAEARKIHSLNLFEEYRTKGWTRHVEETTYLVILPNVINAVKRLWLSALFEAQSCL